MSVTSGFFNSDNHDRLYDAEQFSSIFDGVINDGVYESIGSALTVTADEGLRVTVGIGRAWFNHTWTLNDAPLPLNWYDEEFAPELVMNRIDAVVLEINREEAVRENTIKIVKGVPSSYPEKPVLRKEGFVYQYPLAYVKINAGVDRITAAEIENTVGTSECPFVTGIIQTLSADFFINQWREEFRQLMAKDDQAYNAWFAEKQAELVAWLELEKSDILAWYENLQVQLDGNVAAKLQGQIDRIQPITIDVIDSILEGTYNA